MYSTQYFINHTTRTAAIQRQLRFKGQQYSRQLKIIESSHHHYPLPAHPLLHCPSDILLGLFFCSWVPLVEWITVVAVEKVATWRTCVNKTQRTFDREAGWQALCLPRCARFCFIGPSTSSYHSLNYTVSQSCSLSLCLVKHINSLMMMTMRREHRE